jgi:hypothetical protein
MPISKKSDGWYWGGKGPFASKQKAIQVGQAAHASGYKEESLMNNQLIGTFVSTLLHSATLTHLMHFKSTSYSQHVALAAYYDTIPELVDGLWNQSKARMKPLLSHIHPCFAQAMQSH